MKAEIISNSYLVLKRIVLSKQIYKFWKFRLFLFFFSNQFWKILNSILHEGALCARTCRWSLVIPCWVPQMSSYFMTLFHSSFYRSYWSHFSEKNLRTLKNQEKKNYVPIPKGPPFGKKIEIKKKKDFFQRKLNFLQLNLNFTRYLIWKP